jgi:hypothetical protein
MMGGNDALAHLSGDGNGGGNGRSGARAPPVVAALPAGSRFDNLAQPPAPEAPAADEDPMRAQMRAIKAARARAAAAAAAM